MVHVSRQYDYITSFCTRTRTQRYTRIRMAYARNFGLNARTQGGNGGNFPFLHNEGRGGSLSTTITKFCIKEEVRVTGTQTKFRDGFKDGIKHRG